MLPVDLRKGSVALSNLRVKGHMFVSPMYTRSLSVVQVSIITVFMLTGVGILCIKALLINQGRWATTWEKLFSRQDRVKLVRSPF